MLRKYNYFAMFAARPLALFGVTLAIFGRHGREKRGLIFTFHIAPRDRRRRATPSPGVSADLLSATEKMLARDRSC